PGRRDVFDPASNPTAPGAPRTLGTLSEAAGPPGVGGPPAEPPDIGVPGARAAGAPLDLSSLSGQAARESPPAAGRTLPPAAVGPASPALPTLPPPAGNPSAAGVQTVMAPSATPKDEYDLAYGYVLHKDYALAEDGFWAISKS